MLSERQLTGKRGCQLVGQLQPDKHHSIKYYVPWDFIQVAFAPSFAAMSCCSILDNPRDLTSSIRLLSIRSTLAPASSNILTVSGLPVLIASKRTVSPFSFCMSRRSLSLAKGR